MNPFRKTITTSLSPNTQADDVLLAFALLFQPWRWNRGHASAKIEDKFRQYLGVKHAFAFESGRTCLYSIMKALKLQQDDEVLVQSYTCVAVPEPILWAGLKPVYVDIDTKTLNMSSDDFEKKITAKSKAVIIQHTFGNPSGMRKILDLAKKHGLIVIEDCAHALGAEYESKKVGTFGDFSFFSFGRDKVISSVFGGMVIVNNEKYLSAVADFQENNCTLPKSKWTVQQLLHPVIFAIAKPLYGFFSIGKIIVELSKRLSLTSKAVYSEEKQGEKPQFIQKRLPNALALLALHQFEKLQKYNDHRVALAHYYDTALDSKNIERLDTAHPKNGKNIFLRYTILVKDPASIHRSMKSRNIYLGDWYSDAIAPKGVNYEKIHYNPDTCPNAQRAARMTINLPTSINIDNKDARTICEYLSPLL